MPESIRRVLQRRVYANLHHETAGDPRVSEYPVDASGWLLLELLKSLVRGAAGRLVRLARWPAPHSAAAALTHDIEPSRFAYTRGIERLLNSVSRGDHSPTFGIVARSAERHLADETVARLRRHDVLCHGLEHRGETLAGSRSTIAAGMRAGRVAVERRLGRPVLGFRSPRLDRSPDLLWALDQAGFCYDSSYPDVDRENVTHFGAGVRLNVPFRPPIEEDGRPLRASTCLEVPVSAPDCIQPLFEGDDLPGLRRAVRSKIDFVAATGGLYVGIVHAGVFGERDAVRRERHLAFVRRRLRRRGIWLVSLSDVARWWCARERLVVRTGQGHVEVVNEGVEPIAGVRLVVESAGGEMVHDLPALGPGGSSVIALDSPERVWAQ